MPDRLPLLDRSGVFVFPWGKLAPTAEDMVAMACEADRRGYHSVQIPYFFALDTPLWPWGNESIVDALAVLPVIAARTSQALLNLSHINFSMLHPYVWAQYLSSLDSASGGRAMSTLALAWRSHDFQVGLSPREEADARLHEGFGIFRELLLGHEVPAGSTHWDAEGLRLNPAPAAVPALWVSGGSPSLIDAAARYAHYIKPSGLGPEAVRDQLVPAVRTAADRHQRDLGIAMSVLIHVTTPEDSPSYLTESVEPLIEHERPGGRNGQEYIYGPPEQCAEQLVELFAAGVDYLALDLNFHGWAPHHMATEQIARVAELVAPLIGESDLPPIRPVAP